jgi:hypothetical protein
MALNVCTSGKRVKDSEVLQVSWPAPRFLIHVVSPCARAGFKTCLQGFQAGRRRMVVFYNRLSTMTMQAA